MSKNIFFERSVLEYELPDFAHLEESHYLEAFYEGTKKQLQEVEAIIASGEPTFENTIVALEKSGQILTRALLVFYNKSSSDTSDSLDAIEEEIAPKLSAHQDAITLNPALFDRIKTLHSKKDALALSTEDAWLLDKYYRDFLFAGAHLTQSQRDELTKINERLSFLETQFSKNLLTDTNESALILDSRDELKGLSEGEIQAAADAASARGHEGKYLLGMVNFSGNPLLESLEVRATRERIMKASLLRGNRDNEFDTKKIIVEM
jgi:peptidyl-dipeptidase Dcp